MLLSASLIHRKYDKKTDKKYQFNYFEIMLKANITME